MCSKRRSFEDTSDPYVRAKKRVEKKKGFYKHLTAFVFVNVFVFISNLLSGDLFDSFSMTFFWGLGLAFHYVSVFGPFNSRLDEDWEEREIERELNKMGYSGKSGKINRVDIDERLQVRERDQGYDKSELV